MRSSLRLMRLARLAAVGLVAASLSGCGLFAEKDARFDPAPLTNYASTLSVAASWNVTIGSGGAYGFVPQVVGNVVYAATPSGAVTALDLGSGAVRWQVTGKPLSAGAGSDGHLVAVVTQEGLVVAYDTQGRELWKAQAASAVNVPPAVGDGIVAVRTTDYRVQAFDAATGKLRWNVQRPGPALALRTSMRLALEPHLVIAGMPNGRVLAIDAATGVVRWEGTVSSLRGASDLERISDIVGQPLIVGTLLCGVSYQGHTTCFDESQGGRAIWTQAVSSSTGMATDGHALYLPDERDVVHALDIKDGHSLWRQAALLNRRLTMPAVVGPVVALGDLEGYVHFLALSDGALRARIQVGSEPIVSPLVAVPGGVLVQTGSGHLVLVAVRG